MPLIFIALGVLLVVVAYQNTEIALFQQVSADVPGFAKWAAAIVVIGGIGYYEPIKKPARMLFGLVVLVIFFKNYQRIIDAIKSPAAAQPPQASSSMPAPLTDPFPVQLSGGSGGAGGGIVGSITGAVTGGATK
jgi:hypothetical protein